MFKKQFFIKFDKKAYYIKTIKMYKIFFLHFLGVKPKTYIGNVFGRLFDYYFKNSVQLYKEYKNSYKKEFSSFEEYLRNKHNLNDKEIKALKNKSSYYKHFENIPGGTPENLLFYEEVKDRVYDFFGGLKNED